MKIRFYIDPETKQPHIYNHAVNESEVKSVLKSRVKIVRGVKDLAWL